MGPPTSKWHVGSPNSLWGHPIPPAATGMGPGGNALRCTLGTQREPSHALRWPWGHPPPNGMWGHPTLCGVTQSPQLPLAWGLVAMPCAAPWVPSVSPAMPCVGHGATHLQMACGVTQLFVGSPKPPQLPLAWGQGCSCWWHGTGAQPWCWWLVLHPAASGMGPPTPKWCGVTQPPQLPLAWGHKCSCWWHGTGAPPWCWWLALHPAASGMGPPNSKWCGATQLPQLPLALGPPNSPSCLATYSNSI